MIVISGLTRTIPDGKTILKDVDARLEPGKFIAVVGSSGSGKSALLRALALKEVWTSGEYKIDGKDLMESGFLAKMRFKRQIAYLEQKPILYEKKTALKNVLIGASEQTPIWRRITGMVRSDDYMGAMDMLEHVGLMERSKQIVERMSGGERQRIAIARALVHGARLVLADEPVSGLDPHTSEEMMATLKKLCREKGTTIVAALHRVELAEKFADEIWGMQDGRLVMTARGRRLTAAEKMRLT
ncbi:ATP-binding cassette domain-containing protein [Cohnella sp. LGH]|uniref:Phosphonate transport system ATP-binding protein n=1 Tax=Cohnella phaseoli TaxID=456490 RepID=A0A3D9JVQ1_9BACL|nr:MULTISPECIES: ATP-binding cassette domain-containing protein [Cohnella]QTH45125.1 ATP-binding cassette domain-containing protein [Cohnella sp. LGH]RED77516.1 phosphonate transport system ATP-binding protein [Cohnella phaseoli]